MQSAKENNSRFHRSLSNLESYAMIVGVEDPHPEKHMHANIWQTWDTRTGEGIDRIGLSYPVYDIGLAEYYRSG